MVWNVLSPLPKSTGTPPPNRTARAGMASPFPNSTLPSLRAACFTNRCGESDQAGKRLLPVLGTGEKCPDGPFESALWFPGGKGLCRVSMLPAKTLDCNKQSGKCSRSVRLSCLRRVDAILSPVLSTDALKPKSAARGSPTCRRKFASKCFPLRLQAVTCLPVQRASRSLTRVENTSERSLLQVTIQT